MRIKEPQEGDTRTVTKFLWKRLTIDGETRWLEKVTYVEEFRRESIFDLFGDTPLDWRLSHFVDEAECAN